MSSPIKDKITSDFFESKNKLHPKDGDIVRVFVESEEDISFWKYAFSFFNIKTKISPFSQNLKRGKSIVLEQVNKVGKYLLLCVDSDYDYILQNATTKSSIINNNPYIFQTYTYSIENYFCYVNAFRQIIAEATQNDDEVIDFVVFFENYSNLIFELFCYSIHYRRLYLIDNELFIREIEAQKRLLNDVDLKQWINENRPIEIFKINNFLNAIQLPQNLNLANNGHEILAIIQNKIAVQLNNLPQITNENLNKIKSELTNLNTLPTQIYLFVKGHHIENTVLHLLKYVQSILATQSRQIITDSEATDAEKNNRKNAYQIHLRNFDLSTALRTHKYYENTFWYNKIKEDIQAYIIEN